MNKVSFIDKHPVISSIVATFLFLLVITFGGIISGITEIRSEITLIIAFAILAVILIAFISKMNKWNYYGFNSMNKMDNTTKLLFIPLFIFAFLPLVVGFSADLKLLEIIYIIVFMAIVSFVEETMFRGVILRLLQKKSNMYAIWGSSLLFSIPHLLNTLNGKGSVEAIVQTLFAFFIGLILAMLMIKTNNIFPLIIYHFTNNTVSSVTRSDVNQSFELYFTLIIFALSIVYAIYLYNLIKRDSRSSEKEAFSQINF
ncbi:CPBP family intramembrane glutamic endopeptidase [Gudongella sp. DL1XJH-153]|uniref:CPBP family intramembrane glutamic endopeptidase n=1 Tax=Gudongella sp. DL1XJH-153 TaxID=3409804 RepID=UPI003BB76B7D